LGNMSRHPYSNAGPSPRRGAGEEAHVFRFPLCKKGPPDGSSPGEMLAVHLRELLDIVTPVCGGRGVSIDGFYSLNDTGMIYSLNPSVGGAPWEATDPVEIYEPRINYIRRVLESLLGVVDLESNGEKVDIDGFRLKNLDKWLAPGGGAADILAHAATRCNLKCRFCYNQGAPPAFRPKVRETGEELREILTRIHHYVPESRLNLFPSAGSPCESLAHPRIRDILGALRLKTKEPLRIPTNGSSLTPEMIRVLAGYKPVFVDISLNSASPSRRRWLMNDPRPHVALESPGRLKGARIPYSVVMVPWPFPSVEIMLEDLKHTVAFAEAQDPAFVQVSLPGYSRFFSKEVLFDREQVWRAIQEAVQGLRNKTRCPVIVRPGLFEEYEDPEAVNSPRVIGTIRNSPAAGAGLRPGDRIMKINGVPVKSRPQARSLLTTLHESDLRGSSLAVFRNGRSLELALDLTAFDYPYDPAVATHLGVVYASSGIPLDWVERLHAAISSHGAKTVLVLTSRLVRPTLERMMQESMLFSGMDLHLRVPGNGYLGGNIFMGDLMVVEDFIRATREFLDEHRGRPDLVVIPSSPFHLSRWGRDLTGRSFKAVERETGIRVTLVECEPIFD
jgi:hypothetical protein